ncbi:pyridoxal phosphate-dependent aminotransferase [Streptomyces sp. NPDC057273]|uniref:pyridoxal phosphate-dependent aminotransferase n=1 Tax=Streptomyces sp. NPDC057273 TaxID=3346080 RepID=UPI00364438B2
MISAAGQPTRFSDVALLHEYLAGGAPGGPPVYLSIGETWTEAAPGLTRLLAAPMDSHSHGYVISQYGLPRLQQALRRYIAEDHGLLDIAEPGVDFEVAVACSGTRNAMHDYARLLRDEAATGGPGGTSETTPVAYVFSPGWDYAGVFSACGYRVRHLPLSAADSHPCLDTLRRALLGAEQPELARGVIVINAQHNPTAVNWRPEDVRAIIRMALTAQAAILIDDAYFAVHEPGIRPTNALHILLEELGEVPVEERPPWLAVRSLGKQFNCNGWGIGSATGSVDLVDRLMNRAMFSRSFVGAVPLQEAMASWIEDPASQRYLEELRRDLAMKRAAVSEFLEQRLGYPPGTWRPGECTTYLRFQVPPDYLAEPDAAARFQRDCFQKTGVLFGLDPGTLDDMLPPSERRPPYMRVFLGPPLPTLMQAMQRLEHAGIGYASI